MPPRPAFSLRLVTRPLVPRFRHHYSTPASQPEQTTGEKHVFSVIESALSPRSLQVQDVSGGCGAVYSLNVVAEQFRGLSTLQQHRLVTKALGDEVKKWHGMQLKTAIPTDETAG